MSGIPFKFGPEWLRNLGTSNESNRQDNQTGGNQPPGRNNNNTAAARTRATSAPNSQASSGTQPRQNRENITSTGAISRVTVPTTQTVTTTTSRTFLNSRYTTNRIYMASRRYGKEEMLALYEGGVDAPEPLTHFDSLYKLREKAPSALNAFEDDQNHVADGSRASVPTTGWINGDRSGVGRGRVGPAPYYFNRRNGFVRAQNSSTNRNWNRNRVNAHGSGPQEEEQPSLRPWSATNGPAPSRSVPTDQTEWAQSRSFRARRNVQNTNWRLSGREEGDEWRMQDQAGRGSQGGNQERDWAEKPNQERPHTWYSNRRTWGDNQGTDEMPEWANDNVEQGAGTFDASGAFHGYSNDDTNRQQEPLFPLTKSATHSAITRSKTAEDGSEEWWASEKAKKLFPKRLLSSDFNKQQSSEAPETTSTGSGIFGSFEKSEANQKQQIAPASSSKSQYTENNTFDALQRPEIDVGEGNEEYSDFQSVIISSNNSLRQKHQNIVTSSSDNAERAMSRSDFLQMMQVFKNAKEKEAAQSHEKKIVEEMFEMKLDENNLPARCVSSDMPHASTVTPMLQPLGSHNMNVPIGVGLQNQGISNPAISNPVQNNMQNIGLQNAGLSALPLGSVHNNHMMSLQGVMPQMMPNAPMNPTMNAAAMPHSSNVMGAFQQNISTPVMPSSSNIPNPSLFLGQNNNLQMPNGFQQTPDIQSNMFPMHGIQQSGSQSQLNSMYRGVSAPTATTGNSSLADLWYYEDPEKRVQGPFSSQEMWSWYVCRFFAPTLMVRRACDTTMRPLASYGPIVPFAPLDTFLPLPNYEPRQQVPMANQQSGLGLGYAEGPITIRAPLQAVNDRLITVQVHPPISHAVMESLSWTPPPTNQDVMWMQSSINRPEARVNNLPMYFWDSQPSNIPSTSMLPGDIMKEMKTEDEILAQIRGPQNIPVSRISFTDTSAPVTSENAVFPSILPDLSDIVKPPSNPSAHALPVGREISIENPPEKVDLPVDTEDITNSSQTQPKDTKAQDTKAQKPLKTEPEKVKTKENNTPKSKSKKSKEEKKDNQENLVSTEETAKTGKRSVESSPSKATKEAKPPNKKELEKEKKELIKDGFTIVKGADKTSKENKKKVDEAKVAEEAERKRKEEEKLALEEEKKKNVLGAAVKKQQQEILQKQALESVTRRAPWSPVTSAGAATNKDGLTLAEIQKLEREKKLEQMKEQQQMMQMIAQQQAAALAREQEMQAGLGWAKKKAPVVPSPSLAEIQTMARREAAAAAAQAQAQEEPQPAPVVTNHLPWGNNSNGGFWDTPSQVINPEPVKPEPQPVEVKKKKPKVPVSTSTKKETTPAMEFESWCNSALVAWGTKIDVPTFVGFLKDIESPYEVKDYVKCYLGESKESSDFSRQFLERRSKLLRVGMVTPSDDLCSPALAVNPRIASASEYQEVKGKGKKSKKNKMTKVDARILGFSVTASEDRINIGDIDTP